MEELGPSILNTYFGKITHFIRVEVYQPADTFSMFKMLLSSTDSDIPIELVVDSKHRYYDYIDITIVCSFTVIILITPNS